MGVRSRAVPAVRAGPVCLWPPPRTFATVAMVREGPESPRASEVKHVRQTGCDLPERPPGRLRGRCGVAGTPGKGARGHGNGAVRRWPSGRHRAGPARADGPPGTAPGVGEFAAQGGSLAGGEDD